MQSTQSVSCGFAMHRFARVSPRRDEHPLRLRFSCISELLQRWMVQHSRMPFFICGHHRHTHTTHVSGSLLRVVVLAIREIKAVKRTVVFKILHKYHVD